MIVIEQKSGRARDIAFSGTAAALLERLGINPETVLIVKDGVLVTLDDEVTGAQRVELLSVVSGG